MAGDSAQLQDEACDLCAFMRSLTSVNETLHAKVK